MLILMKRVFKYNRWATYSHVCAWCIFSIEMQFTCIPFYCIVLHNAMRKHSFDKMPMEIGGKWWNGLRWTRADLRRHLCMNTNQTKHSWILKCIGLLCSIQLSFWEISPLAWQNLAKNKTYYDSVCDMQMVHFLFYGMYLNERVMHDKTIMTGLSDIYGIYKL